MRMEVNMSKYRALLVDDENLLLDSLEIILTLNSFDIIGKANDGREALKILEEQVNQCDIALVDLNMKGMGGLELIKLMKESYPDIKILVLTTFYDDQYITEAITGGADGYLLKDSGKDAIIGAITQILGGSTVLDQKVMTRLAELMTANLNKGKNKNETKDKTVDNIDILSELTDREKEISFLMAEGLANKQIADQLYISEGTVKNYISNIYDKTGIHDRIKLIVELRKE